MVKCSWFVTDQYEMVVPMTKFAANKVLLFILVLSPVIHTMKFSFLMEANSC